MANAALTTQDLLGRLRGGIAQRAQAPDQPTAPADQAARDAYRQAAAVLDQFQPDLLAPVASALPDAPRGQARLLLFDELVPAAGGRAQGLFTLRLDSRRRALRQLGHRTAWQQALAANPSRPDTALQQLWEAYLRSGQLPDPAHASYRELTVLGQLLGWLEGLDKRLPPAGQVLHALRAGSVFAAVEHLVDRHFTGRQADIDRLRSHIGAPAPGQGGNALARQLKGWWADLARPQRHPALLLHGPGGIGKSALVARVLGEQLALPAERRLPFAYLPFDQPSLRINALFTLLVEAAAQFELQRPDLAAAMAEFRQQVLAFRDERTALGQRKTAPVTRGVRLSAVHGLDAHLYQGFGQLLAALGRQQHQGKALQGPVLLVFDTFEEVQYRDRESLQGFWQMLHQLQRAYPPLRLLLCGRAEVRPESALPLNLQVMTLHALDMPDRVTLLRRLCPAAAPVAESVAEQVGGNPLTLRLAAGVLAREPEAASAQGLDGLSTRRWLLFQVEDALVQGQLYRRVLDHIHDPDVRAIAHPGMVLRRLDSAVLRQVLAPACLGRAVDDSEAEHLLGLLRQEHALVTTAPDGALVFRADVRQAMVRLLAQDRWADVRALRERAIAHYALLDDPVSRGEELHHRLALGELDPERLDERWLPELEPALQAGLDEYPDRSKAVLASRMSLELPRSVLVAADLSGWERNVARKAQQALAQLDLDAALDLMAERSTRSDDSPLYALEAKARLLQGAAAQADALLAVGTAAVARGSNRGRLAELLWLQAQAALLMGDAGRADTLLARAEEAIQAARDPIGLVHVLAHRLLLRQVAPPPTQDPAQQQALRARLAAACDRVDPDAVAAPTRFVLDLALALLDGEHPATVQRLSSLATPNAGLATREALTNENLCGLDEFREPWEQQIEAQTSIEASA